MFDTTFSKKTVSALSEMLTRKRRVNWEMIGNLSLICTCGLTAVTRLLWASHF